MIARAWRSCGVLLHGATAGRYGYFRDELYFIACAKHLAWGYVDQPPLVAFAAWLAGPVGYSLLALARFPSLAAALTRLPGRRSRANSAAAVSRSGWRHRDDPHAGLSVARQHADDDVVRAVLLDARDLLLRQIVRACAATAGGSRSRVGRIRRVREILDRCRSLALASGCLATRERQRSVVDAWLGGSACCCGRDCAELCCGKPRTAGRSSMSLRGDAAHRPALAKRLALEYRDLLRTRVAFAVEQLLYTTPLAVSGLARRCDRAVPHAVLRDVRFVPIAYCRAFVVAVALGRRATTSSASMRRCWRSARSRSNACPRGSGIRCSRCVAVVGVVAMPLSLPVLPIDGLVAYTKLLV